MFFCCDKIEFPSKLDIGYSPFTVVFRPFNLGFRPLTRGYRPFNLISVHLRNLIVHSLGEGHHSSPDGQRFSMSDLELLLLVLA